MALPRLAARAIPIAVLGGLCQAPRCEATRNPLSALAEASRRFAPPDAVKACEQIGATLEKINSKRPARNAPELLDLLLLRALDANETAAERADEAAHVDVPDPKFVRLCWRHASAAYGYPMLKGLGLLQGVAPATLKDVGELDRLCVAARCPEADVVECAFRTNPLQAGLFASPAYFVTAAAGRVVLAIRGTADVGDALTDLVCDAAPFRGGEAHAGILQAAEAVLRESARSLLVALERAGPGSELVVTGHSMGGGAALLAALALEGGDGALAECLRKGGHRVRAVTFAPPPVVSPGVHTGGVALESYCVGDDVVPTLSLASVGELLRALDAMDGKLTPRERLDLIAAHAATGAKASILDKIGLFPWRAAAARRQARVSAEAVRGAVKEALPDGRGAGDCPLIIPGGCLRVGYDGTALPEPAYPVVRIRDFMFSDHVLPGMEAVLEKLCDHAEVLESGMVK